MRAKPWEVPDGLWERIEPLLPVKPRRFRYPGRKPFDDRLALQGIVFVLHTGIGWEHLPQELGFGCGMTAWRRLRAWQQVGVNLRQVVEDPIPLGIALAERVRLSTSHALEDHVRRSRHQHNGVEARIERSLVRNTAGDEQHFVVESDEQRVDPILPPQLLPTACLGTRHFLGIRAVVGVHDPMSSARELGESRRLARPRHPCHQHHGHDTTVVWCSERRQPQRRPPAARPDAARTGTPPRPPPRSQPELAARRRGYDHGRSPAGSLICWRRRGDLIQLGPLSQVRGGSSSAVAGARWCRGSGSAHRDRGTP
jgi:hypothetical protein